VIEDDFLVLVFVAHGIAKRRFSGLKETWKKRDTGCGFRAGEVLDDRCW
jgi:hypothetical protein